MLRKGNVQTPGASIPSAAPETGELLDAYGSEVREKIKLRWALPFYLRQKEDLSGKLTIYLDLDGYLIRKEIVSSGNKDFDDFMNRALEESLPFVKVVLSLPYLLQTAQDLLKDGCEAQSQNEPAALSPHEKLPVDE